MPPRGYRKEKPTFKCELCSYKSQRQSCFNDHLRVHSGEKPFKCDICAKSFTQKSNLGQHLKVHGAGAKHEFKCDRKGCDFTSKWKSSLLIHERWHDGERPYQCTLCEKTFTQSTHCRTHMRESHGNERKYQCDECSKCFKRSDHLTRHMAFHKAEKNFACEVCGKRFIDMGGLRSHRRIHEGEAGKRYKCDKCPYKSFFKQCLDVHYRIHLGLKPYECDHCGKTFRTSSSVKIHIRMVHQGEEGKIFSCEQCSFSTANKQSLKNHHRRIHLGYKERAWLKCLTCGKVYTTRSSYYSHRRKRHPKLPRVEDIYRRGQKVHSGIANKHTADASKKEPSTRRVSRAKSAVSKDSNIGVKNVINIKRKGNTIENITVKVPSEKPKKRTRKVTAKSDVKEDVNKLEEVASIVESLTPLKTKSQKSPAGKAKQPATVESPKKLGNIKVKLKKPKEKTKKAAKGAPKKAENITPERKVSKRKKAETVVTTPTKVSKLDSVAQSLAKKKKKLELKLASDAPNVAIKSNSSSTSPTAVPKVNRRKSQTPQKSTGPRFSPSAMPRQDITDVQMINVSPGSEERSLVQVAPILSMDAFNSEGRPIHVKFVPVLAQTQGGEDSSVLTSEVCESIQKQALDIAARVKDELVSSGVRVSSTSSEKSVDYIGQRLLQGQSPRSKEINISPLIPAGVLANGSGQPQEENNNELASSEPLDLSISSTNNNNEKPTVVAMDNAMDYDPENVINITPIEFPSGRKSKNDGWIVPERDIRKRGRPPRPMKQKTISVADPSLVVSSMVINVNLQQQSQNPSAKMETEVTQATRTRQRKH